MPTAMNRSPAGSGLTTLTSCPRRASRVARPSTGVEFPPPAQVTNRTLTSLFDAFPPLAPPLGADENPQLLVPAVRDRVVGVQVVEAVAALLAFAVRLAAQHGPLHEIPEL